METATLKTPLSKTDVSSLKPGMKVYLTGYIYMARDAAHKRMIESLKKGEPLPFDVKDQVIYYAAPADQPQAAAWTPMHHTFWIWGFLP